MTGNFKKYHDQFTVGYLLPFNQLFLNTRQRGQTRNSTRLTHLKAHHIMWWKQNYKFA